jgi:SAM-dependent methyltransferase
MAFIPDQREWYRSHFHDVPQQTQEFCGDMTGLHVLNVGCGEMLTDFGLLHLNIRSIVGLDVHEHADDHLQTTAATLEEGGFPVPADYRSRLSYQCYDGENFPFPDETFDMVFSWSAFEHINNVPRVLSEIRRVLKQPGKAFIQVFPWYHCRYGNHLIDFIDEPFFHLRRPFAWVESRIQQSIETSPERRPFFEHMLTEYSTLNGFSANQFYRATKAAGFVTFKAQAISYQEDLSEAPEDLELSDLLISGTKMLLGKNGA